MNIWVILLNWNGKRDTLESLACLEKSTIPHHVVIVDNGSEDGSVPTFQKAYPKHVLIENHRNLGYAEGNNVAIAYALTKKADFVLLLNNDTSFAPSFLENLFTFAKENPKAGVIGPKVVRYDDRNTLDHMGGFWSNESCEYIPYGFQKNESFFNKPIELDYISGCSIFIRKEVFEKIGMLDPDFFLLWEESDFCARAKKAGFEIWATPKSTLFHKVSASFQGKAIMQYYWWRNRLLWMHKNIEPKQRKKLMKNVVRKQIWKFHKHAALKMLQSYLLSMVGKNTEQKKTKLKRLISGCKGIQDFYRNRLGGPKAL